MEKPKLDERALKLKSLIEQEFQGMGWTLTDNRFMPPASSDKNEIRQWHKAQRVERATSAKKIVEKFGSALIQEFADGKEVVPQNFAPELVPVLSGSQESNLFRFATLLWSVPVSNGYGRRMRYLIRDSSNGKLVGIFALMDPVFNLRVRDKEINWNSEQRKARLYHVMDANVLGAVPPYDRLLGGKFVALAIVSDQVRHDFALKYRGRETIIQETQKKASLVLITTTSALGRSSIYNRLHLPNESERTYRSVGYSEGWGHFHISDATFKKLRDWMRDIKDPYADGHQYGDGPNWRMRAIRRGLDLLGFDGNSLWHGIKREAFLAPLASNYKEFLRGENSRPQYYHRDLAAIADFFKERWMLPRSERVNEWKNWTRSDTWKLIAENCGWAINLMAL